MHENIQLRGCQYLQLFSLLRMIQTIPFSTLFPYTTLFRSSPGLGPGRPGPDPFGQPEVDRRGHAADDPRPSLRLGRRSEEHTSELQSRRDLVCRLLLEIKKPPRFGCMKTYN